MNRKSLKEIFTRPKEELSRTLKWIFALPFAYILYIVICSILPMGTVVGKILSYLVLILVVLLAVQRFIKFNVKTLLFASNGRFSITSFLNGFITMLNLALATSFVWLAFDRSSFIFCGFEGLTFTGAIGTIFLLIVAALSEEIIYRCYLAHMFSDKMAFSFKKKLLICFVCGLVFACAHFSNPEMKSALVVSSLFYFIMGFALMLMFLKNGNLSYPFGVHLANNIVSAFFFGYSNSVLTTPTLFYNSSAISPILIIQAVFCLAGCVAIQ